MRCYNAAIVGYAGIQVLVLTVVSTVVGWICLIALIVGMWKLKTGRGERVMWIAAFFFLGPVGTMLYLAAYRTATPRIVLPFQVLVQATYIYLYLA